MVSDRYYILYTVAPIDDDYIQNSFKEHLVVQLKSEIPHTYKYKFYILPTTVNQIVAPFTVTLDEPYLIVCDVNVFGHYTSSMIIKSNKKYIYNALYPITTKQPYRQLKEHIAQYLTGKLVRSL